MKQLAYPTLLLVSLLLSSIFLQTTLAGPPSTTAPPMPTKPAPPTPTKPDPSKCLFLKKKMVVTDEMVV